MSFSWFYRMICNTLNKIGKIKIGRRSLKSLTLSKETTCAVFQVEEYAECMIQYIWLHQFIIERRHNKHKFTISAVILSRPAAFVFVYALYASIYPLQVHDVNPAQGLFLYYYLLEKSVVSLLLLCIFGTKLKKNYYIISFTLAKYCSLRHCVSNFSI